MLKAQAQGRPRLAAMVLMLIMTLCICLGSTPGHAGLAEGGAPPEETVKAAAIDKAYGKLPLHFIRNDGQVDGKVVFYEKAGSHATYFTGDGVYLSLVKADEGKKDAAPVNPEIKDERSFKSELVRMTFLDANAAPLIRAEGLMDGKVNYFSGNDPAKWRAGVQTYNAVVYEGVYEGVDVKFYGNNRLLEYDIMVRPGADPSAVALSYEGIEGLRVTDDGDLEILLGEGSVIQKRPYVYQEMDGKRVEIDGRFRIIEGEGKYAYGFDVASYDAARPLVIDPVLVYSTYLGGSSSSELGTRIAVDSAGNAYVTGGTASADFPTVSPIQGTLASANADIFVAKLGTSGTSLVYSTFLGGSLHDYGRDIVVDNAGNAYVTGETYSTDFPLASPIKGSLGGIDAFVAKLDPSGATLVYSTYLGGNNSPGNHGNADAGYGIAVDNAGNAYVTGLTNSTDFPTVSPIQGAISGPYYPDAFVAKLDSSGTSLVYSTYLGGAGYYDVGFDIAVDNAGNAYVTGYTGSTDFPLASPIKGTLGGLDAFVTKINTSGTSLVYSTYLGGSYSDEGYGIAADNAGNAYVTGYTTSTDFPLASPVQGTYGGGHTDAFVTKIDPAGSALVYSTYLGGSEVDYGFGIAVDGTENAYVTGGTYYSIGFPTVSPIQGAFSSVGWDAFVSKLDPAGTTLVYSTRLVGSNTDVCYGIAVDNAGNAYVTGVTDSTDFPTVSPYQAGNAGAPDAFIAKIGELVQNLSPVASAGPDQSVHAGALVTLDGSASVDPDGNYPLTYAWTIASVPSGSVAALSDPATVNPSFPADMPGDYTVELVVTDGLGTASAMDSVLISTTNAAPVADAGPDQAIVAIGSTVHLNGAQSYDLDGDPISYSWTLASKPAGSAAALDNPSSATPSFTADAHGDYLATLTVSDPWAQSAPDNVTVSFANVKPVADAGGNQSVVAGETVVLNGVASIDANGDALTYSWSLVTMPAGSATVLAGADASIASFIADVAGTYVASLVVNDGFEASDPSNVSVMAITAQNAATDALNEAIWAINHLGPEALRNRNLAKTLTNKINAVLEQIDKGEYGEAVVKLTYDVLGKMDGCAASGAIDQNDWLVTCEAQAQVYPLIVEAIGYLSGLPADGDLDD
jgi:hypothetical protein